MTIQKRIMEGWGADSWEHAGCNEHGVCLYSLYRNGKLLCTDTLLNLHSKGV